MSFRAFRLLVNSLMLVVVASATAQTALPRGSPESVGLSSKRLQRIADAVQEDIDRGRIPGAVIAIARKGKLAYFRAFGYRDKANNVPMTTDTIFDLTSMTKPIVSLGALILCEEGRLALSDPVSKYLSPLGKMPVALLRVEPVTGAVEAVTRTDPATGKSVVETVPAVRPMTIQDLMRHTSGLTYGVMGDTAVHKMYPAISYTVPATMTGTEFIETLSTLPLLHQPGTVFDYGFSTDVLGLVVEAVARTKLSGYLDERVFRPLGMKDTVFVLTAESAKRYAKPLPVDPETGKPQSILDLTKPLEFECGGACAASSASDYLRFVQMLLNGGTLGGNRVVSRKTVECMTADQLGPAIENRLGLDIGSEYQGYGFGLGVAVRREAGLSPSIGSAGDYKWIGAYGTEFWVDPKEQLAVVFMLAARRPTVTRYRHLIRALVMQAIVD